MSPRLYRRDGNAFLDDTELGRVTVSLSGIEDRRGRQANGTITFEMDPDDTILGRDLTIIPDDGVSPFKVVVTQISHGSYSIASQGDMPWWQ